MTRTAFLGLGRMGAPMARRLLDGGHHLVVWNRTPARADAVVGAGATYAPTPADAVRDADVVVTMLADPAAVRAVVDAAADAMPPGSCLVDVSTIGPDAVRELRRRLPGSVALVDAPVMGSVDKAATGGLTVLTGGDADDVARVEPVLAALGRVVRCGSLGQGAATKLVLATAIFAAVPLVGEAMRLARVLGVDPDLAHDLLAASPVGGVVGRIDDAGADFAVDLAAKDLELAVAAAPELAVTAAAADRLRAASSRGHGDSDLAAAATDTVDHAHTRRSRMRTTIDNPAGVPAPAGPYSHVARIDTGEGALLFVSGQVAVDDAGAIVGKDDIEAQSRRIFEILGGLLDAHGATFADVVNIRSFLVDMDQRAGYGKVRRQYLTGTPPTSTTVEVSRLFLPDALLEVELVATVTP